MPTETPPAQFLGDPRPAVPPPLDRARELGIHQVLDIEGRPRGDLPDPDLPPATLHRMYRTMVLVRAIDERGWRLQRSGRMEFWIPSRGQEAAHVGSAMAMDADDWIFLADREPGAMLLRGASLQSLFAQFFGRAGEPLKGRRLPLLLGDRALNIVPCMTQVGAYIPHAAGAAWAAKLRGDGTRFIVYFGDGATSRGEFHSAMNFAGIHRPPIIFFCQNNGWAVSTPTDRQTASASFAEKGEAYAVDNLRVDGNDPLAVYAVTRQARERAGERGASLIEAVTYRLGFHTSSDNPDLYRLPAEVAAWERWDPIPRLRRYLEDKGLWSPADEEELVAQCQAEIEGAVAAAEAMPPPEPGGQFDDVLAAPTWRLEEQRARLLADLDGGG
ncbi:MAG: thiamine pyrophosphate-dependent enzyme [Alphaproteobacteria bacterium]|jgi:TPP-dependent pyruvate/acetoin dehydrogenase alpha subunit|nr:thiamine pyrophosphate-dependent enzyme [Alphaproteobacteria bacterium]MDP6815831.1 thiamine pyrophosphate-dependent enzyme [Alphaproteobacteria bacterium]